MKETPLPSQVRRRTLAILLPTAILALGVAGCTSTSLQSSAGVVAAPAETADGSSAAAIVKTYEKYMNGYVDAYHNSNPNDPAFLEAGGDTGGGLKAMLESSISQGVKANDQRPSWSDPVVQFVDANKTIASVSFCFNPGNWQTVNAANQPAAPQDAAAVNAPHPRYPGDVGKAFRALMLLDRDSAGNWTVQQTNAQPDNPC